MQKQILADNTSGIIRIQDGKIFWDYENENLLEINIDDIVVIGEYTNSDGPYFDDWFLTFITKNGNWQSISWYAENISSLTTLLCEKFKEDFSVSFLTNSTTWASVVRYPVHLKNISLFKLIPTDNYNEPKTFFDKILSPIGFGNFNTTKYIEITDEVKNEVKNFTKGPFTY